MRMFVISLLLELHVLFRSFVLWREIECAFRFCDWTLWLKPRRCKKKIPRYIRKNSLNLQRNVGVMFRYICSSSFKDLWCSHDMFFNVMYFCLLIRVSSRVYAVVYGAWYVFQLFDLIQFLSRRVCAFYMPFLETLASLDCFVFILEKYLFVSFYEFASERKYRRIQFLCSIW